ncbi:MAG: hypothetical protein ACRET4_16485, partial [Steroidobacteraceae bacterium]
AEACRVALTRSGTRVLGDLAALPELDRLPWTSRYLQGLIDVPFLILTPGTRSGVVHDERYAALVDAMAPLEAQRHAEEEQASRESLRAIQRAFREAMLALPPEEYDWFDVQTPGRLAGGTPRGGAAAGPDPGAADSTASDMPGIVEPDDHDGGQRQFFAFAGPLFSVVISPASSTVPVKEKRRLRALPRDRSRRRVQEGLRFQWGILEGGGTIESEADQEIDYRAPDGPGLARVRVTVTQGEQSCYAEALVTVTETLEAAGAPVMVNARGLPGYTFERAAGELWRSRFDADRNVIVVNSGHRDFVFATRNRALQLRYLVRLYVKELVLRNFAGLGAEQLLERMVELTLHTEEKLKPGG